MDIKLGHNNHRDLMSRKNVVSFVFLSVLCAPLIPVYRNTQKHFTNDF